MWMVTVMVLVTVMLLVTMMLSARSRAYTSSRGAGVRRDRKSRGGEGRFQTRRGGVAFLIK